MDLDWKRFKFAKNKYFPPEAVLIGNYAIGRKVVDGVTYVGRINTWDKYNYLVDDIRSSKKLQILVCKNGKKQRNGKQIMLDKILN